MKTNDRELRNWEREITKEIKRGRNKEKDKKREGEWERNKENGRQILNN